MADTSAVGKHYLLAPNSALFGIFQLQSLQMLQMVSAEKFTFHGEHICKASLADFVLDLECLKKVANTGQQKIIAAVFGLFQLQFHHVTLQIVSTEKVTFHSVHIFSLMVRV